MRSLIRTAWEAWKRVAKRLGDVQARLILTVFYFLVLAPFALVLRWRSDPLATKPGATRGWRLRDDARGTPLEQARRQS